MSFQTRNTFVNLRNTNYDIFYEIIELSKTETQLLHFMKLQEYFLCAKKTKTTRIKVSYKVIY